MALLELIYSRTWWHTVWVERRPLDLAGTEIDGEMHTVCTFTLEPWKLVKRIILFSIATLFASFYFIWVNAGVVQLAFLPAKPNQLAAGLFLGVSLVGLLKQENRQSLFSLIYRGRLFISAYLLFLMLQAMVGAFGEVNGSYVFILLKQAVYFACALLLAAQLNGPHRVAALKAIYWGLLVGLVMFLAVFSVISAVIGDGLISLIIGAIAQGDSAALQFGVYPTLFNFVDGAILSRSDADFQGTALRNTLVGVFVLFATVLWFKPLRLGKEGFLELKLLNWALIGCCVFFVLASVSRSNILVLLVAACCLMARDKNFRHQLSSRERLARGLFFAGAAALGAVLLSTLIIAVGSGLADIGADRFGNFGQDPRVLMYSDAMRLIEQRPITGWGLGAELGSLGHRVHNLFIAAWYEGGVTLFVSSLLMYGSLIIITMRAALAPRVTSEFSNQTSKLRNGGVFAIAILPLFRPLVSGDAGAFTLIEWACIAIVLAEYANLKNAKSRRTKNVV